MPTPSESPEPASAAESLSGQTLPGGWQVAERIERPAVATGGNFSVGYRVRNSTGTVAFLKALDFSAALKSPDPARTLEAMTAAYNFERDLLEKCRHERLTRVAVSLADGFVDVPGHSIERVPYLIFESADRDARIHLDLVPNVDMAWRFRALHHVATGLQQLHSQGIAHQDIKPSNVLVFNVGESKIADLGRAAYRGHDAPHDNFLVAGDSTYAPPELLYGHVDPDWVTRRCGCDAFLLGSLVLFFMTKASMTPAILAKLHPAHHPSAWGGGFQSILPYVRDAFEKVLVDFRKEMNQLNPAFSDELTIIVRQLCEPDPKLRGHPLTRSSLGNQFSVERYVSRFDLLARHAHYGIVRVR
jgi:serine/threonine protein kinase